MTTRDGINAALKIIGVAGFSGLVVVASDATKGLKILLKEKKVKISSYETILKELKRQNLIQVTKDGQTFQYSLTPNGAYRLQRLSLEEIVIPKPRKWDKKWRLVIFDIPIKYSSERALFTSRMQKLGFKLLQKSIWAYPYPCFDQVEQIAGYYNLLRYCSFVETNRLDELSSHRLLANFPNLQT